MKLYDKELVIIGSNEYSLHNGKAFFRSGLEPQMEDIGKRFTKAYHYSPKSVYAFSGFTFSDHMVVRPFCEKHHESLFEFIWRIPEFWRSLQRIWREHTGALFMVYVPDSYIGILAVLFLKMHGAPVFARVTSNLIEEMRVRGDAWYRKVAYRVCAPVYIFCMKRLLRKIVQIYTAKKLYHTDAYSYAVHSSSLEETDIKKRDMVEKESYSLYYVGRYDRYKGLCYAIQALEYIKTPVTLSIIGFGNKNDTEHMKSMIEASPKKESINVIGQVPYGDTLFRHYDMADIVLVPSLYETQGKTHLEAMARGAAVVASDVGGIPEIVTDKKNGILVPPADARAIAEAVDVLCHNISLRRSLVEAGYVTAKASTIHAITHNTCVALETHHLV